MAFKDHLIKKKENTIIVIVVYVGDIIFIINDQKKISKTNVYLQKYFSTKDLVPCNVFFKIEVSQKYEDIILSQ